jgi:hypothetical protein
MAFNGIDWAAVWACPIWPIYTLGKPMAFHLRVEAIRAHIGIGTHPA